MAETEAAFYCQVGWGATPPLAFCLLPVHGVGGDYRPSLSIGGRGKVWPSRSSLGPSGS